MQADRPIRLARIAAEGVVIVMSILLALAGDAWFEQRIEAVEAGIHQAPNRKRETMNTALIAIGCRNKRLRKAAEAAAKRIGPVEVDHGATSCKTADAVEYIARTWNHRAGKQTKRR